jgi:hypothetical protein
MPALQMKTPEPWGKANLRHSLHKRFSSNGRLHPTAPAHVPPKQPAAVIGQQMEFEKEIRSKGSGSGAKRSEGTSHERHHGRLLLAAQMHACCSRTRPSLSIIVA